MDKHEKFMQRCLTLAEKGLPNAFPNPLVGCVIVHNENIIGEGYHALYGGPHAEVNAVKNVKDKSLLKESTLYVNLEPCTHQGKTPPCADMIIAQGIKEVVVATPDPNPLVAGNGIKKMKEAGINVIQGVLSSESETLNKRFLIFHSQKRPYVILKWAQTVNGLIADKSNCSKWISNEYSRMLVHKWRSEEQAIMVGTKTAMVDDPALTVRDWNGKNPLRVVIDKELVLDSSLKIFDGDAESIIFNSRKSALNGSNRFIKIDFGSDVLSQILDELYRINIQSMIVEGGTHLLNAFIRSGLWDEARVFKGQKSFEEGVHAPRLNTEVHHTLKLDEDILEFYYNR